MIEELENKRNMCESLFNAFIHITSDTLIDTSQFLEIDKCKWHVLSFFDAEISHQKNKHFIEV